MQNSTSLKQFPQCVHCYSLKKCSRALFSTIRLLSPTNTEKCSRAKRKILVSVVEASESTLNAIMKGLQATTNLKGSIAKVDESATVNKKSVDTINDQIKTFKL